MSIYSNETSAICLYIRQHGVRKTLQLLKQRQMNEKNKPLQEFFKSTYEELKRNKLAYAAIELGMDE